MNFENFLTEMSATVADLDLEFIKRAEVVSSFNVTGADFSSTKYKKEIQYLITKHFFPNFDISNTASTFQESAVNSVISMLKSESSTKFETLLSWTPKGVGPGEVLLYYIIDDCSLGGGSSAGVDITSGNTGYEVKAADLNKDGYFVNFRLGGTANIGAPLTAASEIKTALGLKGRATEINKADMAAIAKSRFAQRWVEEVEAPYKKVAYEYFKGHDTIFIINKTPKSIRGQCFAKTIGPNDVELDVVTGGTIKPKIRR